MSGVSGELFTVPPAPNACCCDCAPDGEAAIQQPGSPGCPQQLDLVRILVTLWLTAIRSFVMALAPGASTPTCRAIRAALPDPETATS